jgi:hypothetical protein
VAVRGNYENPTNDAKGEDESWLPNIMGEETHAE